MTPANVAESLTNALRERPLDSGRAFLLSGTWGCGKTFLWTGVAPTLGRPVVTASAFGVSSGEHLKERLVTRFLASAVSGKESAPQTKPGQVIDATLRSGLSWLRNQVQVDPLEFVPDFLNGALVCIDDLERLAPTCALEEVFGIVNYLTEHKKIDVLLICNEDELTKSGPERASCYERYRERIVFRDFSMQAAVPEVFDRLTSVAPGLPPHPAVSHRATILGVFANSRSENLRDLARIVSGIQQLSGAGAHLNSRSVHFLAALQLHLSGGSRRGPDFYRFDEFLVRFQAKTGPSTDRSPVATERLAFLEKFYGEAGYSFDATVFSLVHFGWVDRDAILNSARPADARGFAPCLAAISEGDWYWLDDSEVLARLKNLASAIDSEPTVAAGPLLVALGMAREIEAHAAIAVPDELKEAIERGLHRCADRGEPEVSPFDLRTLPETAARVEPERRAFEESRMRIHAVRFGERIERGGGDDLVQLSLELAQLRDEGLVEHLKAATAERLLRHRLAHVEGTFRLLAASIHHLWRVQRVWPAALDRIQELRAALSAIVEDPEETRMHAYRARLLLGQIPTSPTEQPGST